jgi:hypothetical protein
MRSLRVTAVALLALLAGCGKIAALQPPPGQPLPVKPLMAKATPTAEQLLAVPIYARPNRVDEVVKRSEARRRDPFDVPPPVGSAAPAQPAGTDPQPVSNETGPAIPQ